MHKGDTFWTSNRDPKPKPTYIQTRKCNCGNYIELNPSGITKIIPIILVNIPIRKN
ncbi:hypothetical protein DPMN_134558 [Dreissena polymorpha]|uniref:Uncharacterized protein n=1 Tax=Dreissena polymorpha TaxID=45954 RepID=A0A9D4JDX2_DREPO|nr:hypothetical protein DPMN_134558 [Dreissena polymorpha]